LVEELGAARLCSLRVEDITFSLVTETRPSVAAGAVLGIGFSPERVHLFDGQTGRRLDGRSGGAAHPSLARAASQPMTA
jgi:sn-glycerol 3-phosphate transport system ATP-binding protein